MALKYHNHPTIYNDRRFDSKKEAEHAQLLDLMRRASDPENRVTSVLYQYRMPIVVNGVKIADYICDFYVSFADGRKELHEVKGFKTDVYKIKKKLVEAIYNDKIIEF